MAVPGPVSAPVLSPFPLYTTYCERPPEPRKSRKRPRALVFWEISVNDLMHWFSTCGRKRPRAMVNDLMHRKISGNDRKRLHALARKRLHAFYKSAPSRKTVKRAMQRLTENVEMSTKKRDAYSCRAITMDKNPSKRSSLSRLFCLVYIIHPALPCVNRAQKKGQAIYQLVPFPLCGMLMEKQ